MAHKLREGDSVSNISQDDKERIFLLAKKTKIKMSEAFEENCRSDTHMDVSFVDGRLYSTRTINHVYGKYTPGLPESKGDDESFQINAISAAEFICRMLGILTQKDKSYERFSKTKIGVTLIAQKKQTERDMRDLY